MGDRIPEGFDGLPGHPAITAGLDERHRCHNRNPARAGGKRLLDRKECGLRIQRVKDRLHEQKIRTAFEQAPNLFAIGTHQLFIDGPSSCRIVDIGGNRGGLGRRSDGSSDKTPPSRLRPLHHLDCPLGTLCASFGQFIAKGVHPIISQGDRLGIKCVGFNNIRTSF